MDLLELPQTRPTTGRDVPKMVHYWCSECEKTPCGSPITEMRNVEDTLDCIVCHELWEDGMPCPRCGQ